MGGAGRGAEEGETQGPEKGGWPFPLAAADLVRKRNQMAATARRGRKQPSGAFQWSLEGQQEACNSFLDAFH